MRSPHGVGRRMQAAGRGARSMRIVFALTLTLAIDGTHGSLYTPAGGRCTDIDESRSGGSNSIVCRTCAESGRARKARRAKSDRMSRTLRNPRAARLVARLD